MDQQVVSPKSTSQETTVAILIDESGSMQEAKSQTLSGYNEYIQTLKADQNSDKVTVTLTTFSAISGTNVRYTRVKLSEIPEFGPRDYNPNGGTPLFDAVGHTVAAVEKALADVAPADRPNIVVMIITDGMENASQEFSKEQIVSLIQSKEKEGVTFVYLGANHDVWAGASNLGLGAASAASYNYGSTKGLYQTVARSTMRRAAFVASGASFDSTEFLNEDEREELATGVANATKAAEPAQTTNP